MARYSEVKRMALRSIKRIKKLNPESDLINVSEKIIERCDFFYQRAIDSKCTKTIKRARERQIRDLMMVCTFESFYLQSKFMHDSKNLIPSVVSIN